MRRMLWGSVLALAVLVPGVARAEDPPFVNWADVLPALTPGYDPNSDNVCKKGHESCVHAVIREMERRWQPLNDACDHDAVFALTYLRTTEEYHRFWHEGHFDDPGFLNHYDAMFAQFYFQAYDAWHRGKTDATPPAWRVAFEAADRREVSATGNLFLGMSAHINRDLPFVLYSMGLAAPDGTSRKDDHDRVNEFLNRVADALFPELAARYDPTVDDGDVPGTTVDNFATFQVVPAWREQAWRHAEALANAPDEVSRALVAREIETWAESVGLALKAETAYGPLRSSAERDAYCAVHHDLA